MGGKDSSDGSMDNVGQDLGEPIEGEIGANVQTYGYRVIGWSCSKHLADSSDDHEDMDVAKYLQEETNKRQ